jgi:pyruvate/2-oxoglutarate dehydrogenase complex dihydrolipoamide dehydrogenase (E3) component
VENLNLEVVGVKYAKRRRAVNECGPPIRSYAAGDICLKHKFTHTADATARMVIQNALFLGGKKLSALTIPWCTYTDPEIAHVGMYERDAKEKGIEVQTFVRPLKEVDRAIADGEEEGFVKIHVRKGTTKFETTIAVRHAGEMISELALAIVGKGLDPEPVIHCYNPG